MAKFFTKNSIYSLILLVSTLAVFYWRKAHNPELITLQGYTQGTTYSIKYVDKIKLDKEIDSILVDFSQALSTYIADSEISRFNNGTLHKFESPYFYPVLKRSKEIYEETGHAFDPSIAPLVDAYGFGPEKKEPNHVKIDSVLKYVNFDSIYFDSQSVCKLMPFMRIDFNAIAQGFAVDVVAEYLEKLNIHNYMVEIGGEVRSKGKNEADKFWNIGINNPEFEEKGGNLYQAIVSLENKALATSGNYRKFYVKDGKKYSHTIDPRTGEMVQHGLLSATVITTDGMSADAYATAFMVIGLEKAIEFTKNRPDIEALLVYNDASDSIKTYISEGLNQYMIKN